MMCPYCNNDLWFCTCLFCTGCGKPTHLCICSKGKPERFPDPFLDLDPSLPPEIWEAARVLTQWADNHGHRFWQIRGVCDRRFVRYKETIDRAPAKPMPPCQPEPAPAPAKPEPEVPKCFQCGGDPKLCECESCYCCGKSLQECSCLRIPKPAPDKPKSWPPEPKAPSPDLLESARRLSETFWGYKIFQLKCPSCGHIEGRNYPTQRCPLCGWQYFLNSKEETSG